MKSSRNKSDYLAITLSQVIIFSLFLVGHWIDFAPSDLWYLISWLVAPLLTWLCFSTPAMQRAMSKLYVDQSTMIGPLKKPLIVLAFFAVIGFDVSYAGGGLAAYALGENTKKSSVVSIRRENSKHHTGCSYRALPKPYNSPLPRYLCIPKETYNALKPEAVATTKGLEWITGYLVTEARYKTKLQHARLKLLNQMDFSLEWNKSPTPEYFFGD